jgi:hypothetical protein
VSKTINKSANQTSKTQKLPPTNISQHQNSHPTLPQIGFSLVIDW